MSLTLAVQPEAPPQWGTLAAQRGLFYHHPAWISGLRECFGLRVAFITASEGSTLVGGLPLAEVPPLLGPRRLVSLPFGYAAGPLATSDAVADALAGAARELAAARGARRVEIKQLAPPRGPSAGYTRTSHYATYRVPLAGGEEGIWQRLHAGSTRRSIRKSERSGVTVQVGDATADWALMADLEEATAHRHGLPAPPRRFFLRLCPDLQRRGLAQLYLARTPSGVAAAGIVVWKGEREWIYAFGASRPDQLALRPNHLLLWTALRDAVAAGVDFDLGRAAPEQRGLSEFKRRWGGMPVPLAYDYWPRAAGLNTLARDRGALGLAARIWSRLPRQAVRPASALYRYLG